MTSLPRMRKLQREGLVIGFTAVLGFSLSLALAFVTHRWSLETVRTSLTHQASAKAMALHDEISEQLAMLRDLAALYEAFRDPTRDEFQRLSRHLLEGNQGLAAVGWIPRIPDSQRERHEQAARSAGFGDYRIRERNRAGRWREAPRRAEHFPVLFVEPLPANLPLLGLDLASETFPELALGEALSSGEPHATGPIQLLRETARPPELLFLQPIQRGAGAEGEEPSTAGRGFVFGVYRIEELMNTAFDPTFRRDFRVEVFDLGGPSGGQLLYPTRGPRGSVPGEAGSPSHGTRTEVPIHLPGRIWQVRIASRHEGDLGSCCGVALVVLLAGLAITAALTCYLERLRRAEDALRRTVHELQATQRELSGEKERAQVTLRSIVDGVITTDPEGRIQFMNPVAERLTEWTLADARDRHLDEVVRIIEEDSRVAVKGAVERCLAAGEPITLSPHSVLVNRSGGEYAVQDSATPIRDPDGELKGMALVLHDATEHRRMVREIAYRAGHDALTGLLNRREFERRLRELLDDATEHETRHALCYLDLDHFKIVNDTAGHQAGDELLKELAGLLQGQVRRRDTLARLGGDEFGLLLHDCPLGQAKGRAESLVEAISEYRFVWEGRRFEVGASVGLVPVTGRQETLTELMSRADIACYSAKEQGRHRVCVYSAESGELDLRREALARAADLSSALENDRFRLFTQPIYALRGGGLEIRFHEVLLRLDDGSGSLLNPADFIPAAESFGLMGAIDRWVVRTSLRLAPELLSNSDQTRISINLSGNSLADESLLDFVYDRVQRSRVSPDRVCFEITETAAIRNLHHASHFVRELKKEGCRFALDDFGSGLASFSYLRELPVDYLKIDGSFVRNMVADTSNQAMVAAIHEIGRVLGLGTIAEHVGSGEILEMLRSLGVDFAQGFALSAPRPILQSAHASR